jgi:H+/Cl- antiporter ClcA
MRWPAPLQTRALPWLQELLARRWRQLLDWRGRWQPREDTIHLALAAGVGVVGGLCNAAFYVANQSLKLLFLGRPGDPADIAAWLNPWLRFAVPALGGLAAGLVLHWGLRFAGRGGPPTCSRWSWPATAACRFAPTWSRPFPRC